MDIKYNEALKYYDSKNYDKAFKLFEELAHSGNLNAQMAVATMLEEGDKIKRNLKQAYYWYEKAALQNDVEALHIYALYCLKKGEKNKGYTMLNQATGLNYVPAINSLANIYDYGDFGYEVNKKKAIELYKKACLLNDSQSCKNLYSLLRELESKEDVYQYIKEEIGFFKFFKIIILGRIKNWFSNFF